jgi:hypothetical protein
MKKDVARIVDECGHCQQRRHSFPPSTSLALTPRKLIAVEDGGHVLKAPFALKDRVWVRDPQAKEKGGEGDTHFIKWGEIFQVKAEGRYRILWGKDGGYDIEDRPFEASCDLFGPNDLMLWAEKEGVSERSPNADRREGEKKRKKALKRREKKKKKGTHKTKRKKLLELQSDEEEKETESEEERRVNVKARAKEKTKEKEKEKESESDHEPDGACTIIDSFIY